MIDIETKLLNEFKTSTDTLWIYNGEKRIFSSDKDVLAPLVEFISQNGKSKEPLIILDKVMGNAAALLAIKAGAQKVYSPLGSKLATGSLEKYKIEYHLEKIVPYILARNGIDICPMEKLSIDKEPDQFYELVKGKFIKPDVSETNC